ncbi:unnamed protein product, partial [Lymnaea stagnalis]
EVQANQIVFILLSQSNEFHARQAEDFEKHVTDQVSHLSEIQRPQLFFTHRHFVDVRGSWTIFPLIEHLIDLLKKKDFSWVFICEEDTRVNVQGLVTLLKSYNASQHYFLGRELRDKQTTIIHHFAFADDPSQFTYPDFRAGLVLSITLIKHLHKRLQSGSLKLDFSIDPKHEFALFVWEQGLGTSLLHVEQFCSADDSLRPQCITRQPQKFPECGEPVRKQDLFVAVKTCKQYHETRVPVVKATWGKETDLIEYFSEVSDVSIPTTDLGVPNTDRGHCGKTMAIIQRIIDTPALSNIEWVLIADDDTIINLDRLLLLLACYNHRQPVALGERYGYAVARGGGYDYITGGGGMVFSQPAVRLLSNRCRCYSDDAPDDMTLGMCLKSIGVPVTHSRFFHQVG